MKKISIRPVTQLPFRKTLLSCMITRDFNSLLFDSIHPNPLVHNSRLWKEIPSSGFRPFFSSTSLARASKHPDPQVGKLSKRGQQEKIFKSKLQNQHSQRPRDDYKYIDPAPPRRDRDPRSSYPLAVLIVYPSLSWQLMFIPISFPGWLLVGGEAIYSILALKYGWQPYLGHAGHLGGTAFGLLAGILSMRFGLRRI
ncbi:hypothetical protein EYC84_011981 [Monilinia fructicola]|uniref:Peptidase S54 rhomboid domain-containing protein n=1 Tax=Monilinia fructicola TaxID=38448 RepID=A0A5M9J6C4_MONFR|nr:hypothetical protein EYC84_011981 [Monilinia fructicola]